MLGKLLHINLSPHAIQQIKFSPANLHRDTDIPMQQNYHASSHGQLNARNAMNSSVGMISLQGLQKQKSWSSNTKLKHPYFFYKQR